MPDEEKDRWTDEQTRKAIERAKQITEIYNRYHDDPQRGKKEITRIFEKESDTQKHGLR